MGQCEYHRYIARTAPQKALSDLHWKMGVEFELLAPPGLSRRDLAEAIAQQSNGSVHRIFHPESEPSKVPGTPIFENLTLGYQVEAADGSQIAQCVDDLTLQQDLDSTVHPKDGWYRIVSDDRRILQLVKHHCNPEDPLPHVLRPLAKLFGSTVEAGDEGIHRVADQTGASVALAARLPGERERPCELITAPIEHHHGQQIEQLLAPARELGFGLPQEAAVHLHFDAKPLCSARAISNLVQLLWNQGEGLKQEFGTNPHCVRLGPWPTELLEMVCQVEFLALPWTLAKQALASIPLTKFCDFNLVNLIREPAHKHTFEVRILPPTLDVEPVLRAALRFQTILERAQNPRPVTDLDG